MMSGKSAIIAGFEAGSGVSASWLSFFLPSLLIGVMLIITGYILISLYQDLADGNSSVDKVMLIVIRVMVLLSILILFVSIF